MIRHVLIALSVMSLELGYQGIGLALVCPEQPKQISKDFEGEVNTAVVKIGPVSGGELKAQAKNATQDLLGKLPNADRVYFEQMMLAVYCSALRDDKSISDSQKTQRLFEYIGEVRKTIEQQAPKTKQATGASPLKQPGKDERSGTRSPVNPPVTLPTQAERDRAPKAEKELLELENRLASLNAEIAQQAKEIAFMSTGGDSFCYLGFLFAVDGKDVPSLVLFHNGKYPLQNVRITITDMELLNTTFPDMPKEKSKARPNTMEELEKLDNAQTQFIIPALGPPGSLQELQRRWELPKRDQVTYSITILTQFQTFYQHLKMRKVNGSWSEAYRVIKQGPTKEIVVLLEKVPSNFPKDQFGKVNWLYE